MHDDLDFILTRRWRRRLAELRRLVLLAVILIGGPGLVAAMVLAIAERRTEVLEPLVDHLLESIAEHATTTTLVGQP